MAIGKSLRLSGVKQIADINATDTSLSTTTVMTPTTSTVSTHVTDALQQNFTTTAPNLQPMQPVDEPGSSIPFWFCTVLFFVAIALIAKIVISSKRNRGQGGSFLDRFGISTSRSSGQTGRLGLGGGPALGISLNGNSGLNIGSGSASYRPMPNDSPYAPPVQESRLDWERQFFDDDDEEHLASNMEQEPRTGSRLQLNIS
ncbi:hypothetical protein Ddc_04477 [Ditylenchus destructor]|nr:hypothetical protein Ddc_04477 [Ditylenchus destructor]